MLESASENGFRCSLCRPQGNMPLSDSANLVYDFVAINKCATEVLHSRNVPLHRPHSVSSDPITDGGVQQYTGRTHSFDGDFSWSIHYIFRKFFIFYIAEILFVASPLKNDHFGHFCVFSLLNFFF